VWAGRFFHAGRAETGDGNVKLTLVQQEEFARELPEVFIQIAEAGGGWA